jgi:hypothetical protein
MCVPPHVHSYELKHNHLPHIISTRRHYVCSNRRLCWPRSGIWKRQGTRTMELHTQFGKHGHHIVIVSVYQVYEQWEESAGPRTAGNGTCHQQNPANIHYPVQSPNQTSPSTQTLLQTPPLHDTESTGPTPTVAEPHRSTR